MNLNFFILFVFYWYVICSVVGYGLIFSKYFLKEDKNYNFGYLGFYGLTILILYAYLINLFFSLNYYHNFFLLLFGLIHFIFFIKNNFYKLNKKFNRFFFIFLILFISILASKAHDDFSYYHFPYTYNLINNDLILGIGHLNHGFRTISSIFYFNSLLYLPIINYNLFHLTPILVLGFSNFILINFIFKNFNKLNYITLLSLLSFGFINIFFYRIAEHGTDRSALIILFIIVIEILILINSQYLNQKKLNNIILLVALTVTLKAFYFLYFIILFPIFLYLIKNKKNLKSIKLFFFQKSFIILFLMSVMVILSNILNTGCALYPVHFTCLNNLLWTIDNQEVLMMNNWYEQWSKAGATPNFRIEDPENYIKGFNWVTNWIDVYFFNKVSDFLLGLILLILVIYFYLIKGNLLNKKIYKIKFGSIYFIIVLLFLEWFYNHPALRYGGYTLICLLLFIPFSIFFNKYNFNKRILKNRLKNLILVIILIFFGRNVDRIYDEILKYNYRPLIKPFYTLTDVHYRFDEEIKNFYKNYNECLSNNLNCDKNLPIKIKKTGNFLTIYK